MRLLSVILGIYTCAARLTHAMMAQDPDMRIAIVGCGPAGLLQARELRSHGFRNIEVFERGSECASLVTTMEYEGPHGESVFADLGTSIVVGHSYFRSDLERTSATLPLDLPYGYEGPGRVAEPYASILREIGIGFSYYDTKPFTYDFVAQKEGPPIPANIDFTNIFTVGSLVYEALRTLDVLEQILNVRGVQGVIDGGFAKKEQTFGDWIDEFGIPTYGKFMVAQLDLNSNQLPTKRLPAAVSLKLASVVMPEMTRILFQKLPIPIPTMNPYTRYLLSQTDDFTYLKPIGGYRAIINGLKRAEEKAGVIFHFDSQVSALEHDPSTKKVKITTTSEAEDPEAVTTTSEAEDPEGETPTSNDEMLFDAVINAVRPQESASFLKNINPINKLYQDVVDRAEGMELIMLWRPSNLKEAGMPQFFDPSSGELIQTLNINPYPESKSFGSNERPPSCVPMYFLKEEKHYNHIQIYIFAARDEPVDECFQKVRDKMSEWGMPVKPEDEIGRTVHDWHSTVHIDLVANGWFEDADAAQGVDRVFHTGEIFSTVGVQNVADYVHKKTPDFVEALNKLSE